MDIKIFGKSYRQHRLAWFYMTEEWPTQQIDHINGKKDDNRWLNLRDVSPSENTLNRSIQANNTSGYKGISKQDNGWVVYYKGKYYGFFADKIDAINKRKEVEDETLVYV